MESVLWQSKYREAIQKALDSAPKDWHKRERDIVPAGGRHNKDICPFEKPNYDDEELTRKCEKDCSG